MREESTFFVRLHKTIRGILTLASILCVSGGLLMFYITGSNQQILANTLGTETTTTATLFLSVGAGFLLLTTGLLCMAMSLQYRPAIHQLSHDAIMEELEQMLHNVLQDVHRGLFDAVPAHRQADEIARHITTQVQRLDARIAAILGKLGQAYLQATDGMGEAQLEQIQHKLRMSTSLEVQAQQELADIAKIVAEMEENLVRFEVLGEANDTLHASLIASMVDIKKRMRPLARHQGDNVTKFPSQT